MSRGAKRAGGGATAGEALVIGGEATSVGTRDAYVDPSGRVRSRRHPRWSGPFVRGQLARQPQYVDILDEREPEQRLEAVVLSITERIKDGRPPAPGKVEMDIGFDHRGSPVVKSIRVNGRLMPLGLIRPIVEAAGGRIGDQKV